ncbi:MAG: putative immunity protein [Lachnospirales bacterium]
MAKLRKMLGKADSIYIESLMRAVETQSKETIAKWCLDYAEEFILPIFENHCPEDGRPRMAITASREWFEGKKKLPEVKNIILNECHAVARELEDDPIAQAAARACGQASACFHTPTHSLGLAFYGAAAIAYERVGLNEKPEVYDELASEVCREMERALGEISIANEENPAKIKWNC